MSRELPTISSGTHTHSTYSAGANGEWVGRVPDVGAGINWNNISVENAKPGILIHDGCFGNVPNFQALAAKVIQGQEQKMTTRLVRVFVIDPNDSLPLENRMLYRGTEKLTDLNDQELFFELPVNDFLTKHNELRAKTADRVKSAQFGKEVWLEPARIRDLRMTVLVVAQFQ